MVRKQLIMDKAVELFAEQGIETTSIQQITEYAGISKGAFYLSFKSKNELITSLIDQFMASFISDIDHIVKTTKKEELLTMFYHTIIQSFLKHSHFGKVLIQEHSHSLNEDLLDKMHYYNTLMHQSILLMIDELYGKEITDIKYDLMYCIKGFINMYSEVFLFKDIVDHVNIHIVVQSLVEKTHLIAIHATTPFITKGLFEITNQPIHKKVSQEQLLLLLDEKLLEVEDPIVRESLILLKAHLDEPTLQNAVVFGLIKNIQQHSSCKWLAYLFREYYEN